MQKTTLACGIYDDSGFWRYYFGVKDSSLVYSGQHLTKELAVSAMKDEIDHARLQFGDSAEVLVDRQDI